MYLLEPVLGSLSTPKLQWQTTYILLLWLSLICLAPFDLASVESLDGRESLVTRLLDMSKQGLKSAGKERDACAILCARVLSRGDVWRTELGPFILWAIEVFTSSEDNVFLVFLLSSFLIVENWIIIHHLKCPCSFREGSWSIDHSTNNAYPSIYRIRQNPI